MFSNIVKFLKVLMWPILFLLGQFVVSGLFMISYMLQHPEIDFNDSSNNSILIDYINGQSLFILSVQCIIFIPLFYFVYKKCRMNRVDYSIKSLFKIGVLSFLLSSVLNLVIITLKHFIGMNISSTSVTFTVIVATGIIGPILEELLFRGIVYGKFIHVFKEKNALFLSVLVFALFHVGGIFQVLFAGIIGYFLTVIYGKYHDIRISMMAHIVVNITSILLSPVILLLF